MQRYSRYRPLVHTYVDRRRREGDKNNKSAKIGKELNGASRLDRAVDEPEFVSGRTAVRHETNQSSRWFVKGRVPLGHVVRAADKGAAAVVVWLAVKVHEDYCGAPAPTAWLVAATGLNLRTVQKAAAALVKAGMLKRDGYRVSLPSYMKERP
jgi:hypothetical protein